MGLMGDEKVLAEGAIDTLSVLQVQARVVAARAGLISIRGQRLAQRVNLRLALGGSLGEKAAFSATPRFAMNLPIWYTP